MNFNNARYVTKGFAEKIPLETQLFICSIIDEAKANRNLDYLQVFTLSPVVKDNITMQKIIHSQEQPEITEELFLITDNTVTGKVFCIDDETHHTFLLADEY